MCTILQKSVTLLIFTLRKQQQKVKQRRLNQSNCHLSIFPLSMLDGWAFRLNTQKEKI